MSRTAAALVGLLVAFGLVGANWFVTTRAELSERAERVRTRAEEFARGRARRAAEGVAGRLEKAQREGRLPGELPALERSVAGTGLPARLASRPPARPGCVRAPVGATGWWVEVDAAEPRAQAEAIVLSLARRFRATAATFGAVALLISLLVAVVVRQAEEAARERSRFAASAAHELRTPLAGLRLHAEMLAEDLGDPAARAEYARRLASEAARLGRVVANVLGFSRLERGRLRVRPSPGDLAAAVRHCVAELQPSLEAAGARVELQVAPELPSIPFDRDAIVEIARNLVDNAEKYARGASDRAIEVRLARSGAGVALAVRDHGPGLPPRARRHLFRPFRRFVAEDGPAGLGLGLALARSLARAHGGDLVHEEADGGGARFVLFLPG